MVRQLQLTYSSGKRVCRLTSVFELPSLLRIESKMAPRNIHYGAL